MILDLCASRSLEGLSHLRLFDVCLPCLKGVSVSKPTSIDMIYLVFLYLFSCVESKSSFSIPLRKTPEMFCGLLLDVRVAVVLVDYEGGFGVGNLRERNLVFFF